jgi:hypothetical protein
MKEVDLKAESLTKRPNRGSLKASEREVDQDFESLCVPVSSRCPVTKRFNKKHRRGGLLGFGRRRQRFNKEIEGLDGVLGLASFLREGGVKEVAQPKRLLGLAATHVAIAHYIKYQQQLPSTPSTSS